MNTIKTTLLALTALFATQHLEASYSQNKIFGGIALFAGVSVGILGNTHSYRFLESCYRTDLAQTVPLGTTENTFNKSTMVSWIGLNTGIAALLAQGFFDYFGDQDLKKDLTPSIACGCLSVAFIVLLSDTINIKRKASVLDKLIEENQQAQQAALTAQLAQPQQQIVTIDAA